MEGILRRRRAFGFDPAVIAMLPIMSRSRQG
jgi:hypothetical protein